MQTRNKIQLIFVFSLLSFGRSSTLHANLANAYGLGAIGMGMAGARSAIGNTWGDILNNVASLTAPPIATTIKTKKTLEDKLRDSGLKGKINFGLDRFRKNLDPEEIKSVLGFGYTYQAPFMNVNLADSSNALAVRKANIGSSNLNYGVMQLGFSFDLRRLVNIPKNIPVKIGAGIAFRGDGTLQGNTVYNHTYYNFKSLGGNVSQLAALISISVQPWKNRLSVGFGPGSIATISGRAQAKNLNLGTEVVETNLKVTMGTKGFAPVIGAMYRQPINGENAAFFSLVFKTERYALTDLVAEVVEPILYSSIEAILDGLAGFTPHTIVLGSGYIWKKYLFSLDMEYQMWSRFKLSGAQQKALGTNPNFSDTFNAKIGAEMPLKVKGIALKVRSGVGFRSSYTPDQTGYSNYLDNTKLIFASGVSYLLEKNSVLRIPMTIDFGIQYQAWLSRESTKAIIDVTQPNYSYGGGVLLANLSISLRF